MYDIVFVTHLPSFYKTNLYSELSKNAKIAVIFLGGKSEIRNEDFTSDRGGYDFFFLSEQAYEQRSKIKSFIKLRKLLSQIQYRYIIVGGWEEPEFWYCILAAGKARAGLNLESTIFESNLRLPLLLIKNLFCRMISFAFPSGIPHYLLLKSVGFKGKSYLTGGVGLTNHIYKKYEDSSSEKLFTGKLLYVGRLAQEKNIEFMIDAISADSRLSLTIIGDGPLKSDLEQRSCNRIKFEGYVSNKDLDIYYRNSDAILLTSERETWGLVIEEAAYYGCPSIVNSSIGCSMDFVSRENAGVVYEKDSHESFNNCINSLYKPSLYKALHENCNNNLYLKRKEKQVSKFLHLLAID